MELELLKKSWTKLDTRMQHAATFNQKLVESIISSRVMTTVDKIKRMNRFLFVVLALETVFLLVVLMGNPFDFEYTTQFVPFVLLIAGVVAAFFNLMNMSRSLNKLSPALQIDHYLKGIVAIYDGNKRLEKWFGVIFLSLGLSVPFSFLPQKIEKLGLSNALLDIAIMVGVTLVIYVIAFRLGAFKNPYKNKLEKDLAEWQELKALANRMEEE